MIEPITATQIQRDYALAAYMTGGLIPAHTAGKTPREMAIEFASERGISLTDFFGKTRFREVSHPRQDCMRMLYAKTSLSMPAIGRVLGGRDHTTVLHGIRASERRAAQ